jgi:aspartyl-tRNA(Asn)/glutamyl-tRNA(Gln) amidotransferase subunit A
MSQPGSVNSAADGDLAYLSIEALGERLRRRDISPVEITRIYLDRIAALDPELHAFITVTGEQALADAAAAERAIAAGQHRGPLHGVPLAIKDLFYTAGVRTTAGSRILADFEPTEDAAVVSRLRAAGALSVGKTNMEEFAYGATSLNPHYGACCNPWDGQRIAGGSSGGSAAAVAAGLCAAALGSDSGGSIRQPAALCGLVGLKPTYGRMSKHGVVPLSWSQDHVGPLTRTVRDAALLLQALAGHDPRDPASSDAPVPDYLANVEEGVAGCASDCHATSSSSGSIPRRRQPCVRRPGRSRGWARGWTRCRCRRRRRPLPRGPRSCLPRRRPTTSAGCARARAITIPRCWRASGSAPRCWPQTT